MLHALIPPAAGSQQFAQIEFFPSVPGEEIRNFSRY
jgi:hypothetical protein